MSHPRCSATAQMVLIGALLAVAACQSPIAPRNPSSGSVEPQLAVRNLSGGTTYYLSPTGNDQNEGTSPAWAWKTLAKANSRSFRAGDWLLLQGGAAFAGTLTFDAGDQGTAAAPIVVSTYGIGQAMISAGNGDGILIYNTAGLSIRNLVIQGSGPAANAGNGINVFMDLAGGVKLDYLVIDSLETFGFGKYGIVVGSWNATSGFKNVTVTNTRTHDNTLGGLVTYAQAPNSLQNVVVRRVQAYNNTGKAGLTAGSGNGIVLGGVTGGLIERSVAHDNGALCNAAGGPVGIWVYDSDRIIIQNNESYRNRTGGLADGGGFDLDQNTGHSTVQYNYSHDNDGAGFLLAQSPATATHTGNVVRYNISENDSRKNSYGSITVYGRIEFADIYNNTVYLTPSTSGTPRGLYVHNTGLTSNDVRSVHLRNNAFYTTGGLTTVEVTAGQLTGAVDIRFEGNDYYGGAVAPKIIWGAMIHTALSTWRSATGQELLGSELVGTTANPGFASPGTGGTIGNADLLNTLGSYRLLSTSRLIDRGLNLPLRFGMAVGLVDFYAATLPHGLGYDVGASEW